MKDKNSPQLWQWEDWCRRLEKIQSEIEQAFPEHDRAGLYDHDVATLVRFAWEKAYDEKKNIESRKAWAENE